MRTRTSLGHAVIVAIALGAGVASAEEKAPAEAAKAAPGAKTTAKALCDDEWVGGFWTIEVNQVKGDGKVPLSKPYNPQRPAEPWVAPEGQYLRMGYFQDPDRRNQGLPAKQSIKMIGRFYDRKEADAFLKKVYADSAFSGHLNPRYPPFVSAPGALLVSDKYTCTLDKENDTLTKADWIVEVEGRLFAGAETACKQGKKRKTVAIVDCAGKKVLAKDTWAAPCDGSRVDACLIPMSPGTVGIQQDYSASGEGRQLSFRVYDVKSGRKLFGMWEGYDPAPVYEVTDVKDVDGDGVPELSDRRCENDDCRQTRLRKWDGKRFVDVRPK